MKKFVALLTALMLLAIAPLSLAEELKLTESASGFDVTITLPEGATRDTSVADDSAYTILTFADSAKPKFVLSIAPSDEEAYAGRDMKDLTAEERESLYNSLVIEFSQPTFEMLETANGYDCMFIEESDGSNMALYLNIHQGWFVQVWVNHEDYSALTEEDLVTAKALLDSMVITDIAK